MDQQKINRINELARKAKEGPLTPAEQKERDILRRGIHRLRGGQPQGTVGPYLYRGQQRQ